VSEGPALPPIIIIRMRPKVQRDLALHRQFDRVLGNTAPQQTRGAVQSSATMMAATAI
jgi:hypothetical protein